ncbi:MAG: SurA N-terminal domain-containing protein [Candidatus Uhrbacteria bacterium]|nr:SurA N-terminal domain-containing protein [Candidatus Uhrbacteria bacterium]
MEEKSEEQESLQEAVAEKPQPPHNLTVKINLKVVVAIAVIIFVAAVAYYFKGYYVAALVNGTPISRLSVIQELEKQSGKSALESLITKQLIENEAQKKNVTVSDDEVSAEIKKIEDQLAKQGGSLQMVLSQQGMTEDRLREQIGLQKKIEKIIAEKIAVSDAEVDTYIQDSKAVPEKDEKPEDMKIRIKEQLKQDKFSREADAWVTALKDGAKIQYFVDYK